MGLDLLDRKGKYSNGCHWPQPAWRRSDGSWQPAVTHFTSLADPSAVGSGMTGLVTLMHEAGHAAHFANTDVRSPLFSQERAPTSVPYAELQSMFLDSLVGDAAWRGTYAKSRGGDVVPWALLEEDLTATHPYKVLALRSMLSVPYFEKALYEMADEDLTAAAPPLAGARALRREARRVPRRQPKIGPTLTGPGEAGNTEPFLDLVERTGAPLSGDAWSRRSACPRRAPRVEKAAYDAPVAAASRVTDVDLDMRVRIVDDDAVSRTRPARASSRRAPRSGASRRRGA
ncbi:peptidase [Aureococcus anophagefferens]|nr:peptidase [Aureococcus anophagefferens]